MRIVSLICLALVLVSCSSETAAPDAPTTTPSLAQMESVLRAELVRLGKHAEHAPMAAPAGGTNGVFDLVAALIDPDGPGGTPPTGIELAWTERLIGDYDLNGLVNLSDLTPLGMRYMQTVDYDDAASHGGIAYWPTGDGADGADGSLNWVRARVDGDANSEINLADITPIAAHWNETMSGYRVYRRAAGEADFTLLPDPGDPGAQLTVARSTTYPAGSTKPDPNLSVRYTVTDGVGTAASYEYYVAPYDPASSGEGPVSNTVNVELPVITELIANIAASTTSGPAPLTVNFSGIESDNGGAVINNLEWDFDGDGSYDESGHMPTTNHTYETEGEYEATLRITDSLSRTDTDSVTITVEPAGGEETWNLLVWFAADNDLAENAFNDIQELEAIGSTASRRILIGYDIDPEMAPIGASGIDMVHFIKVVQDSEEMSINTTGDPLNESYDRAGYDSSDPSALYAFVSWATNGDNFPADHTALILWDHGDGWRAGAVSEGAGAGYKRARGTSGILVDDADGPGYLQMNGIIAATLQTFHFDVILLDACNMGHIEALYAYRNLADWLVASEVLVPLDGYPYTDALENWTAGMNGRQVGEVFVDAYNSYYTAADEYATQGVYDASKFDPLATSLADFAAQVTTDVAAERDHVKNAMGVSFEPDASEGERDLQAFLTDYAASTANPTTQALANTALQALDQTVVYYQQYDQPDANGMTIWLPRQALFTMPMHNEYSGLHFNTDTDWLDMLDAVYEGGGGETAWLPDDILRISWDDDLADIDLLTIDPDGLMDAPDWYDGFGETDNLLFSLGSTKSGAALESAQLKAGASNGEYHMSAEYYGYDGAGDPPSILLTVELLNSDETLKELLGTFTIAYEELIDPAALLTY